MAGRYQENTFCGASSSRFPVCSATGATLARILLGQLGRNLIHFQPLPAFATTGASKVE
jgi:hypothetical protein